MTTSPSLSALVGRVEALRGTLNDYAEQRLIEYELARHYPPMADPAAFLRDARDPAMFDAIVKDDKYDGIPRWTADLQATAELVERLLPAWQYVIWGGAIEVGHTKPRCFAEIRDAWQSFKSPEAPTPALALLLALLKALTQEPR